MEDPIITLGTKARFSNLVTDEMLGNMAVGNQSANIYNARILQLNEEHGLKVDPASGTVGILCEPATDGMVTFRFIGAGSRAVEVYLPRTCFVPILPTS